MKGENEREKVLEYLKRNNLLKVFSEKMGKELRLIKEYYSRKFKLKEVDLILLFYHLGLEAKDFGIDRHIPPSDYLIRKDSLQKPILTYKNWKQNHEEEILGYSEDYFKRILLDFETAEDELLIYRYFNNHEVKASETGYFKGYSDYYSGLEKLVENRINSNRSFRYVRIMAPPLGVYARKHELNKIQLIQELVQRLFPSTLEHCLRMLLENIEDNISFYLLTQPRRLYNLAIIDSNRKLLKEMYMIQKDGLAIPDEVNVYDQLTSAEIADHIKAHHTDLSIIIKENLPDYCIKLTLKDFVEALSNIRNH